MLMIILWTFYLFSLVTTGWDPAFSPIKHIVPMYLFSGGKKKNKMFTKKNIPSSCVNWRKGKEAVFTVGDFSPQCIVKFHSYKRWEQKMCPYTASRHKAKRNQAWQKQMKKKKKKKSAEGQEQQALHPQVALQLHWVADGQNMVRTHSLCYRCDPCQKRVWGALPDLPEGFPQLPCAWGQGRCHRSFPHALALHKTLPNGN